MIIFLSLLKYLLLAMDDFTALHFSAQQADSGAIIEKLIEHDKTLLNAKITKGAKTALHLAVLKGNSSNVETLLKLGADYSLKTSNGETALDLSQGKEDIKALLMCKAAINQELMVINNLVQDKAINQNENIELTTCTVAPSSSMLSKRIHDDIKYGHSNPDISTLKDIADEEKEEYGDIKKAKHKSVVLSHLEYDD
jgi:ankyrin repeat protein